MRRLILPSLLALSMSLAACGGGDEGLSQKEYRAEAKKICQNAQKSTEGIAQPTKATNPAIIAYLNDLLKVNEKTTQQFQKLDPPKKLENAHEEVLSSNKKSVAEVQRLVDQLEAGKKAETVFKASQTRLQQATQAANEAIKGLGVPECGS
jgi:hypothetical protein